MGIVKSEQYIQCLQFYTHLCSNSYMNIKLLRLSMFSKTPKPKCKHPFYYIKDWLNIQSKQRLLLASSFLPPPSRSPLPLVIPLKVSPNPMKQEDFLHLSFTHISHLNDSEESYVVPLTC